MSDCDIVSSPGAMGNCEIGLGMFGFPFMESCLDECCNGQKNIGSLLNRADKNSKLSFCLVKIKDKKIMDKIITNQYGYDFHVTCIIHKNLPQSR